MASSGNMCGRFTSGFRKFAGQVTISLAATICATAIYGHFVAESGSVPPQALASASSARAEGGIIDAKTFAYYPEHLAALDSLSRFQPVSAQRTAELAGTAGTTRTASLADAAKPRHVAAAEVLPPPRPTILAQVSVLPPRRPVTPAPAVVAEATPQPAPQPIAQGAKIWGVELPHFVPTGATVMDKLASMKDRIGGLIRVSSR